jgi:hypothetical protein
MEKEKVTLRNKLMHLFKLLLTVVIILFIIEAVSFLLIRILFPNYNSYTAKRIASGFTVYYNTPFFNYGKSTIKNNIGEKDLVVDSTGFLCERKITTKKPPSTIRIFLCGGSALFGLGQAKPYDRIKSYPEGVYSYEASIAGCLKRKLDSLRPDKKFEVINAACSGFTTKQSMMLYLDKLNNFSPDYVVEFDGFNDIATITMGGNWDYYASTFKTLGFLFSVSKNLLWLNSVKLLQLIDAKMKIVNAERLSAKITEEKLNYDPSVYSRAKYNSVKAQMEIYSHDYLKIVSRYCNIVKADSVKMIYVLQPMLNRSVNKQISRNEKDFMRKIDPFSVTREDVNKVFAGNAYPAGIDAYDLGHLSLMYYFDDGFSDSLRRTVEQYGCHYIDANSRMITLGNDFEFFTDYCHLTPQANEFVAAMIAGELSKDISPRK